MKLDPSATKELKTYIAIARKREVPFGICFGTKAGEGFFVPHKTRAAEMLGKEAKKEGGTAQFTFGRMTVQGKKYLFVLDGPQLSGFAKKAKKAFQTAGLNAKIVVLDPSGGVLEEDGEEEEGEEETEDDGAEEDGAEDGGTEGGSAEGGGQPQVKADVNDPESPAPAGQPTPEAGTDPLAAKWAQAATEINKRFEKFGARPDLDLTTPRRLWDALVERADAKNFEAALKGIPKMVELLKAAVVTEAGKPDEDAKLAEQWEKAKAKLEPMIAEVLLHKTPQLKKIQSVWTFAQSKANETPPNYATSLKAVGMLATEIAAAREAIAAAANTAANTAATAAAPADADALVGAGAGGDASPPRAPADQAGPPGPSGTPDAPVAAALAAADLTGDIEDKIKRLGEQITALRTGPVKIYTEMVAEVGTAVPALWETDLKAAETAGATDVASADEAKIDTALKALSKLEGVVKQANIDRAAFNKALEVFDLRLVPLTAHHQATSPEIAPEIKKITDLRAEAIALSTGGDDKAATAKITGLEAKFAATEALADDFAHFLALDPLRKLLADENRGVTTNDPAIDAPTREIETLYAGAQANRTAKKFKDGVAKLDKIAEVYASMAKLREFKVKYENDRPAAKTWVDHFATEPAPARALLATKLTELGNIYTKSDVATTKDYKKSITELAPFWDLKQFIENEFPIVTQYPTDLAAFEAQLAVFKAHPGKDGIKIETDLMETDLAKAKTEAGNKKYSTAIGILAETQPKWADYLATAVAYKAYIDKRDIVAPKIAALKGNASAAVILANAETLMAGAAKQALNRDYVKALATAIEAEKIADAAKTQADAQAEVEGLYDEGKLDNLEKKWDEAFKVYTDIRDKVVAADTGGVFTLYLAKAQLPAQAADTAHKAKKYDDARAHLDSAIMNLRMGLVLVGSHESYLVTRTALAAELAALKTDPPNTDACLQPQLDAIDALLVEADDLIKAEAYDYTAADAKLGAMRAALVKSQADGELYKQIKAKLVDANQSVTWIDVEPAPNQALLADKRTKITALIAEVQTKQNAGDFEGALKVATEAALWKEHTRGDVLKLRDLLSNEGPFYGDKIAGLTGPGKEAGAALLAEAATIYAKYEALRDAGTFETADSLLYEAKFKVEEVEAILLAAQPYDLAKTAAETAMVPLRAATNAIVKAPIDALEARQTAAILDQTQPNLRAQDYGRNTKELTAIEVAAKALLTQAQGSKTYEPARTAARAKLDEAKAHAHADAIEVQLTRLEGKYVNMTGLADKLDYTTATTMAAEITTAAEVAIKSADNHAILESVNAVIGGDEDSAPWWPQVAAAKLSIAYVGSKENAQVAKTYLDAASAEIKSCEATKDSDAKTSKGHLLAALEACNTADEVISQYAFAMQEINIAKTKIATVESHTEAGYVTAQIDELKQKIAAAETTAAAGQNYDAMSADIAAVFEGVIALTALCDAHKRYTDLRALPEVEPRLAVLEAHEHRYAIKPNIDTMRKKLAEAQTKLEAHEAEAAIVLLQEARAIGTAAFVMAQMRKDVPPTEADIKEILARPGGAAELDAMIENLEPETSRAVVKVAFKARFGCDIDNFDNKSLAPATQDLDDTQKGPDIVAFYKAMQDLPLEHTLDNDSMRQFTIIDAEGQGSFYRGSEKRVVMHEGDPNTSAPYTFGNEEAIGSPDDATTDEERAELENCQPANEEEVTFFSWNTLHEVGHAVDDQQGFMSKRSAQAEFGGWVEYGLDHTPVAAVFQRKFQYDEAYILEYMAGKSNIVPATKPATEACSDEDWEARRIAVCAHIDLAREKKNPWNSMSVAKKLAFDGTVYQESYPFRWTSYNLAARSRGITGYQFRAPGEWFSELYAAYHAGKLKPANPAVKWLETL